jgi:ATP-dependent RNA helicase DeaD
VASAPEPEENGPIARIYIGAGRLNGLQPGDVVGAIAGESGIEGRRVGTIDIADKYTVVELPDAVLDRVVAALKRSGVKGRKVTVRRFVEPVKKGEKKG